MSFNYKKQGADSALFLVVLRCYVYAAYYNAPKKKKKRLEGREISRLQDTGPFLHLAV